MRTLEIKLYKFSELSEEAKKTAIDRERKYRWEHGEPLGYFNDYCKERAIEKGFTIEQLRYSLSYSQGDGLSFSGRYNDLTNLFAKELGAGKLLTAELLASNCTQIIKSDGGRYAYASKSQVDLYLENYTSSINVTNTKNIDAIVGKVLTVLENKYMELCNELKEEGYAWIESYNSDETITTDLTEDEFAEYTEDGQRY